MDNFTLKQIRQLACVVRWRVVRLLTLVTVLRSAERAGTTAWLTFLTVVKLVKLAGFRLALAKDQVVSDVPVGFVGRFPLQDDLGGRVG